MNKRHLTELKEKLENAVAFGCQAKGNLEWAKAQLAQVELKLAAQ